MPDRIAALPMYDADRAALGAWWRALATAMRSHGLADVPEALARPGDLPAHWTDPRLLLSQTCGLPLVTLLRGRVQVVGAFRYTAPGCSGIHYRSALVCRDDEGADAQLDDFRGRIAAINEPGSHSGCNALRAAVAPLAVDGRFFARTLVSGSHRASLARLRDARADIAAIDCVSLAGFERADPGVLDGLCVIGRTAAAPGLPLITSATTSPGELAALRAALAGACVDPGLAEVREALFIDGFEAAAAPVWDVIDALRHRSGVDEVMGALERAERGPL